MILLDVDYTTQEGRPFVRLYLADGGERRIELIEGFEPYFYVIPDGEEEVDRLVSILRQRAKRALMEAPRDPLTGDFLGWDAIPSPIQIEEVTRHITSVETPVLKVTAKHPRDVRKLRDNFRWTQGVKEVREADILYGRRFLIDHDLRPLNHVTIDRGLGSTPTTRLLELVADVPKGTLQTPTTLQVRDAGEADLSGLRMLSFDIETDNPHGFPKATRDPIVTIAWATSDGRSGLFVAKDVLNDQGELVPDDSHVVQQFADLVKTFDPDVILTYNGNDFDWPYTLARAELAEVPMDLGREGSEVILDEWGNDTIPKCRGRALVDLYVMVNRDIMDLRDQDGKAMARKTLKNVSEALGVVARSEREIIDASKIAWYWRNDRDTLLKYAKDDATATLGLAGKLLPSQFELCRLTRIPLADAYRATRGQQVEWFLIDAAYREGEIVPNRQGGGKEDDDEKYEGAFVFEPEAGLHYDVQTADFEALYPSIMIERNIGPDSYLSPSDATMAELRGIPVWTSPAGHAFRQDVDSFFKKLLVGLKERRIATKAAKKDAPEGSSDYVKADNQDKAFKALINSFYGYTGWKKSRYYFEPCAVSVTLEGQRAIKRVAEVAQEMGMSVIAGDTDSVFLTHHDGKLPELIARITAEMPLKLDRDNHYDVMFFTGAKKRYCGIRKDKKGRDVIDVKGLETRRTDWSETAKALQWTVINTLLRERDPQAAMLRAREVVQAVQGGAFKVEDLTVWKRLNRHPGAYTAKMAHVEAVKRALADHPNMRFPIGDKVGFLILHTGATAVTERSIVDQLFDPTKHQIDVAYYLDRQIMPAALRILEYFGYTEDDLKGRPAQKKLDGWFT